MNLFKLINLALIKNLNQAGVTAHNSHYLIGDLINEKSVIVDLGANVGSFYSLIYNKYGSRCYAIEASESLYRNLPHVAGLKSYNCAIGKANGTTLFYTSENPEANSMNHSVSRQWGVVNSSFVQQRNLGSFLEEENIPLPVDVLKIDIEGAELDVINYLSVPLLREISQIPIEIHDFLIQTPEFLVTLKNALIKLKNNRFLVIKISEEDWRETLCINRNLIKLSLNQIFRLQVLHPLIKALKRIHYNCKKILDSVRKN